jgi:uncharacterized protein YtpQ (UPF0354 family)
VNAERLPIQLVQFGQTLDVSELVLVVVRIQVLKKPLFDDPVEGESFFFVHALDFFDSDSRDSNVVSLANRVAKAFAEGVDLLFVGIEIETSVLGDIFELDELLDDQFDVFNIVSMARRSAFFLI